MSSQKTAQRRLSLLAGSSLAAATIAAAAFTGTALAPTAAFAANECAPIGVDPAANGATADSYTCAATTYATGITYSSNGALTVAKTNTGTTTVTANGVNLTGNGADSVTWDSAIGTVSGGAGTAGPVIDVTSVSGPISITTAGVTATQAGTTHGIRATSTGGGAITITRSTGAVNNNVASGEAAIQAVTNGGSIAITTAGATTGYLRGIVAQTSGTGAVTLNIGGNVAANTTAGVAGIVTTAGTGATAINITSGTVSGGPGVAIQSTSASTSASAAVNVQNTGGTVSGAVNFSGVTAGGVTFNNTGATSTSGRWQATGASVFSGQQDTLTMAGTGQNTMAAGSSINFAGGNDTWTLSSGLAATGASIDFGDGADVFNLSGTLSATDTSIDFGAGTDAFGVSGTMSANGLVTIDGLEAFNHSGVIYLGGTSGTATDGVADDVLRVSSGTFTGSGDARVVMDVILGGAGQAGCATIVAADCLDLRGGSTAGVTVLTLNQGGVPMGRYDPVGITLVDVGGGTSAAGHFVLDPNTEGYFVDPTFGPGIQRLGLFNYAFAYDPANQRHGLFGVPRSETLEYAMLGSAAHSIWHMTADTVTDRQTDLRAGAEGVVWLRTTGEYSKRDVATAFELIGDTFAFDNSYKLYAGTIMGGMDLVSGQSGDLEYVLGVQIGYVGSAFDLDASEFSGRMTGATGGLYGSVWNGRYFIDTTFNANMLTLDYDSPGLGKQTNTYLNSVGARLEAGRRFALSEHLFVDPLATLAFVRTGFEEISLTGGEVLPDDTQSLRGALGLRVGGDTSGQSVNFSYFVAGRYWEEFKGEDGGLVRNPGDNLRFEGDFGGSFTEAEAGLSLYNAANTLSGFLTTGVKSGDAYSAVSLSLGVNMRW